MAMAVSKTSTIAGGILYGDVLFHVRAECDEYAHGDGERIEHLPHGGDHRHPRKVLRIGHEEVLYALQRAGTGDGIGADDQRQQHEDGHHDLGDALDAVFNAGEDDDQRQRRKDEEAQLRGKAARDERAKIAVRGHEMRLTQQIFGQILDDPAADDRIVGHDQYGDNGVDPAAEAQSGPIAEGLVRADGTLAGHAADGGFGDDHRIAEGHGQDDIDQQENAAAVLCRQIGEAPDVPQPDGRARRGKDEADFARKGASFVLAVTHKNLLSLEAVSKIPGSSPPPACPPPRSQMKEAAKGLTDRAALPLLKGASDHAQPRGTKRDARLSTDEGAHCVRQRALFAN